MQEMNEGNVYNVQDVFGSKLNSSALGIKKVNKGIKSQLFDSFKRNKIKNKKEIVQKTFDNILEADAPPVLVPGKGVETVGDIFPAFDTATNPTGAGAVIVTNPAGTSINTASFGMGFEVAPNLTASVQQFVNQYADKTDNSSVKRLITQFLNDLKDQSSCEEVISEIRKVLKPDTLRMLVSSCWQSGLNYSAYSSVFAEQFITGDYLTAIECFTVIESSVENLTRPEKDSLIHQIREGSSGNIGEKMALAMELISVLE